MTVLATKPRMTTPAIHYRYNEVEEELAFAEMADSKLYEEYYDNLREERDVLYALMGIRSEMLKAQRAYYNTSEYVDWLITRIREIDEKDLDYEQEWCAVRDDIIDEISSAVKQGEESKLSKKTVLNRASIALGAAIRALKQNEDEHKDVIKHCYNVAASLNYEKS